MGPLISGDHLIKETRKSGYCVCELSRKLGLCPRQVHRLFKIYLKMPPKRWMLQLRIDDASALLSAGENVKTISLKLNYYQSSHFIRDFKKVKGHSPLKEKRNQCGPELSAEAMPAPISNQAKPSTHPSSN